MNEDKKNRAKSPTVEELLAMVKADPGWVARRDAAIAKMAAQFQAETQGLRDELAAVGVWVQGDAWDLVNRTSSDYYVAIPILLEHLRRSHYHCRTREGIARSLAIPEARAHWREIRDIYVKCSEEQERQALACALAGSFGKENTPDMIELLNDKNNGESRILLLSGLNKLDKKERLRILRDLEDDPDLSRQVRRMLRGHMV